MLTPQDIQNPSRKSGYEHVTFDRRRVGHSPFAARTFGSRVPGRRGGGIHTWVGSRRATALEAAQDYCDYVNGNPSAAPKPRKADLKAHPRGVETRTITKKGGFKAAQKFAIHQRAGGRCECCNEEYPHPEAHHIDSDGLNSMENGASLCRNCHGRITHGDPATSARLNLILSTKRANEKRAVPHAIQGATV